MRSLVSYDDLEQIATTSVPGPPPAKKRKRPQNKRKSLGPQKFAHWDEPVENRDVSFTDHDYTGDLADEIIDVESRELTYEEIWDDSALIEAWDAAMDEYKVFHGSENKWKTEPILKPSPLWHNVPPSASGTTGADPVLKLPSPIHEEKGHLMPMSDHDSVPLNFNTFVPSHDPALPNLVATDTQNLVGVSQDEAFRNALNAMYWTGYWTAIYHCRRTPNESISEEIDDVESGKDEAEGTDAGGTMDEFVTSQR